MAKTDSPPETRPTFEAAVLRQQGVTFAVVVVSSSVLERKIVAGRTREKLKRLFRDMPIVLMAQKPGGTPTYYGRRDLVKFLSKVGLKDIPFKEYTITPPGE